MEENNVNATAGAETKKSKKGLIIGLGIAFLVVLAVIIILLVTVVGSKKAITGEEFEKKLKDLGWDVYNYTSLMSLDVSGESEGMKEMYVASKGNSSAVYVVCDDENYAKDYYKKGADALEELIEEGDTKGLTTKKFNTGKYDSLYAGGKIDDEEGWRKISRIGDTVVVIEAEEEDNFKAADKALGY